MGHSHVKHSPVRFGRFGQSLKRPFVFNLSAAARQRRRPTELMIGRQVREEPLVDGLTGLVYTRPLFGREEMEEFLQIFTLMFYYCSATPKHDPGPRDTPPGTPRTPSTP